MKIILGAALGALLFSGSAMAQTAPAIGVFSHNPLSPNAGNTSGVPVGGVLSTPYTYGDGDSNAVPRFDYRGAVRVGEAVADPGNGDPPLPDSTMALVNRTGGGR
ncbi:MAG TPA: hypothetical protein VMF62_11365 [Acetobacteraceae bacterium]|jgi:hypothetical protein|nr:hypothetical protein [Acetobacteraceae bacterium]